MCTYMYFIIFFSLFSHRASPRHASVSVTVTHLTENVIDVQFADETSTGTNVGDTPVHHGLPQLNKQGVFITRADDEEDIPRVVGLPLSES